jgi:type IV secretory pathway TrbD component
VLPTYAGAINKPRLVVGLDRRMIGLAMVVPAVFAAIEQRVIAGVAFVVMYVLSVYLTRKDENLVPIYAMTWRQKGIYDPGKRRPARVVIEED